MIIDSHPEESHARAFFSVWESKGYSPDRMAQEILKISQDKHKEKLYKALAKEWLRRYD